MFGNYSREETFQGRITIRGNTVVSFHFFVFCFCLNLILILYNSKPQNEMCDWTKDFYFFLVCKNLHSSFKHLIQEVSSHSWLLWPILWCLSTQRLPRGCPEAAQRLPRDCPKAAQRLHEGCPEATWRLPKSLPNRGKSGNELIYDLSFIHIWLV